MRDRRRPADRRLSRKSRPCPKTIPGDPEHMPGLDGHLRVHRPLPVRAACACDATRPDSAHDFGRNIIPVDHRHAPRVRLSVSATRTASSDAYWRDVGTLDAYFEANMDLISRRSAAEHVRRALADPHLPAEPAAAEVRVRRGGPRRPPRPGARQHRLPGLDRLRRHASSGRSWAPTRASTASPTSRTRSCSTASTSAATRSVRRAIIDKGVHIPAGHARSATTTSTTAPAASPSATGGVVVIAKADGVDHFLEMEPLRR